NKFLELQTELPAFTTQDWLRLTQIHKNGFVGLYLDIGLAVKEGIKKYNKYYSFMDESDMYYNALVLDPRDNNSGKLILQAIRWNLHRQYPLAAAGPPCFRY
ncbi:hypothetical protein V1527DRAFT_478395, partial [Lipomyces starkeyi]